LDRKKGRKQMNNNTKKSSSLVKWLVIAIIIFIWYVYSYSGDTSKENNTNTIFSNNSKTFNIIASSENEDLENVIQSYAKTKGYDINVEYAGTLDIMQKLNSGEKYDAAWVSNSIWLYMLDSSVKTSDSKYTSINPVIFAITKSKAEELGFVGKTVYTQDIVNAISEGKLKFSMANPTSTNSGATAYLGLLSTLAGNPEVLKAENLADPELKGKLVTLFTGMERSSGSEDFLEELFLNGSYEAVVTYESSIININKQLQAQGKETLYAIYPIDGVSISDSPLAYIDNGNENKKEVFTDLQQYILSDEGQKLLQEKGRRTWYGGVSNTVDKTVFNPEWGIDTTKYISPTKFPSTAVIKSALNLYQTEFRKPIHVAFCLDYSGSMSGDGYKQLMNAMDYILTDEAANDLLQFSDKDKIEVIPFGTSVLATWSTANGTDTQKILTNIHKLQPSGTTALYPAAQQALELLKDEDSNVYNSSIILMTDGQANVGSISDLRRSYLQNGKEIPIYSIMFGQADERQLQEIANLTNAKIFNGKTDLVRAFKEVRGYN